MPRFDKVISIRLRPWLIPGLIAVLVLFLVNTFFFKLLLIPSKDMRPNYTQGDLVLLYKTNKLKNNDVIAFRFYSDDSLESKPIIFVQRLIGLPGDSITIESGFVSVNSIEEKSTRNYFYNYHLKSNIPLDSVIKLKYKLIEGGAISGEEDYSFSISEETADELRKDTIFAFVDKKVEKGNFRDEQLYMNDSVHKWNKHNFGPLYIPKKGDILLLDTSNICLYKKLIEAETHRKITVFNSTVLLDKEPLKSVNIKENYYFVLGDNRDNSVDSRYWGLLPEDYILGKIIKIVYKNNK